MLIGVKGPNPLGAGPVELNYLLSLHRSCMLSRLVDDTEQDLVDRGLAHFHVSGAGHELTAALAPHLSALDMLFLHYRDKALCFAHGMPLAEYFESLLGSANSHSAGRQMSAHYSWRPRNIASIVGPVGNNALQAVGAACAMRDLDTGGLAVCSLGDGTSQQGEFLEALTEAARWQAPVLFLVENNGLAISTSTSGRTPFDIGGQVLDRLFDIPIRHFAGWFVEETAHVFSTAVDRIRMGEGPLILLGRFERLGSHTNADDSSIYRPSFDPEQVRERDPLHAIRSCLRQAGVTEDEISRSEAAMKTEVDHTVQQVRRFFATPDVGAVKRPLPAYMATYTGAAADHGVVMREALNKALGQLLHEAGSLFLYGQDIEDPKGDVFGVTRGLSTRFPGRVCNAPLSESTIVGTLIGRCLAGQRAVGFIQFADFLPLALNQILNEMATMYWRTKGQWECPVIILAPVGGYKPGLGPFHAQSPEGMLATCPGIDILYPASAGDAAAMLIGAFRLQRPTIILYPKALLNTRDRATSRDIDRHMLLPGSARTLTAGSDVTLVAWGNTVPICETATSLLAEHGIETELIDLRSIVPWDQSSVIQSARRTGRLIVVHEDNLTGGFGAEIVATVTEQLHGDVVCRRLARSDNYVPFNFKLQTQVLPGVRSVVDTAAEICGFEAQWSEASSREGASFIAARGSGPSDDVVLVVEFDVSPGDLVEKGQCVAVVETAKAAVEVRSDIAGTVIRLCAAIGEEVRVGEPLVLMDNADAHDDAALQAEATFVLKRTASVSLGKMSQRDLAAETSIGIGAIGTCLGDIVVSNEFLNDNFWQGSAPSTFRTTGIRSRRWHGPDQTVLSMAVEATRRALSTQGISVHDLGVVIACTGTPDMITPSLASRVVAALNDGNPPDVVAFDINAACCGFIYALDLAAHLIPAAQQKHGIIITSEVMSDVIDRTNPDTAAIFADAASATVIMADADQAGCRWRLGPRLLGGRPEPGHAISVPQPDKGFLAMKGRVVFADAVRTMTGALVDLCRTAGISLAEVDTVVPHQANLRIMEAVARKLDVEVFSVIEDLGNTSSSSIPIALSMLPLSARQIGLVAFGGGYTYGACLIHAA